MRIIRPRLDDQRQAVGLEYSNSAGLRTNTYYLLRGAETAPLGCVLGSGCTLGTLHSASVKKI